MHPLPRVSLRHVGIYVTDFDMMLDFYCRLFGFQVRLDAKALGRGNGAVRCGCFGCQAIRRTRMTWRTAGF